MEIYLNHSKIIFEYLLKHKYATQNEISNLLVSKNIIETTVIENSVNTLKNLINYCSVLNNPHICLIMGEIDISRYGLVQLGFDLEDNLFLSLKFLVENQNIIFPCATIEMSTLKFIDFSVEPILYTDTNTFGYRFSVEYHLSQILNLIKQKIDASIKPKKIFLKYSNSSKNNYLSKYFDCEVTFNSKENRIFFDITKNQLTKQKTIYNKDEIRYKINNILENLSYQQKKEISLKDKVVSILNENNDSCLDEYTVATYLNMHPRTLRRKLKKEGITFREILNDFKMKKAIFLLLNSNLNTKQIAFITGFKNNASFSKAFKNWTGKSPLDYKNLIRN
ncbi:helix-turn-helix domain-containing protein [Acinetobacter baumannii]|uniref:helix-turn-helix domain-containing protein n=1 Tax=Acinetobacter baumannii TaxID=470 RepID=UPI000D6EAC42|nr:helix-turn-helix transcriptional regulator [Acinetobacter baumannii]